MRVITGSAKSIHLVSKDKRTRPLSDRAKSSLFDIISANIPGSKVLDLYAGTGALGIESLSRGASFAQFVDISQKSIDSINDNLQRTHLEENASVLKINADEYVRKYLYDLFDIIFVCPPYPEVKYHVVKGATALLEPNGILIFEHHKKDYFKPLEALTKVDERTYGIVRFEIYQRPE